MIYDAHPTHQKTILTNFFPFLWENLSSIILHLYFFTCQKVQLFICPLVNWVKSNRKLTNTAILCMKMSTQLIKAWIIKRSELSAKRIIAGSNVFVESWQTVVILFEIFLLGINFLFEVAKIFARAEVGGSRTI